MASLHTSAFTRPALLERVEPALLQRFLRPHRSFLAARGFSLETTPNLDALAGILMDPGPECPRTLLDALFCIGEMSLPAAADALQDRAERSGVVLNDEETSLELALRVWMTDPEALLNAHAERAMLKVRSFQYFSSASSSASTSLGGTTSLAERRNTPSNRCANWASRPSTSSMCRASNGCG